MAGASLRDPLGAEAAMAAALKKYAYPADAEVVEVGTGGNTGKVKVRLPGELTPTADLPWAPVVGSVPAVSDRVLALVEFASRRVITGGTGGGGSYTLPDASTTVKGGTKLSVAPVSPTSPIAVGDNDTRMTNARTPTAHKTTHEPGGTDALTALTDASIAAANKDGAAGTASMRTLGTSAASAAAGNRGLPSGGSSGQVLAKSSGTDYDVGWVAASGGGAADPITDPEWFDDFLAGGATTGTIGALGWEFTTATVTQLAGEAGHPGILRRTTAATVGQIISTQLRGVVGFLPAEMFDITFSFRSVGFNSAQFQHKMGLLDTTNTAPANGIYIEQTAGTANIIGRCRAAGVNTDTAAIGTLVTDTWTKIRIRRISGTQVGFTQGGGTELTLSTGIPTAGLIPVFQFLNGNATARSHDIDYFKMKITGLTR